MPFDGSGNFTRVYNWVADANASIPITASRVDTEDDGFATGLSTAICKDGQSTPTAQIPFPLGTKSGDGSVAAPAYSFTADLDTGMYRIGANDLALAAGGTKILEITSTTAFVTSALNVGSASANGVTTINGKNSGTSGGSALFLQLNGTSNVALGNKSAINGTAYDSTPYLFSSGPLSTSSGMNIGGAVTAFGTNQLLQSVGQSVGAAVSALAIGFTGSTLGFGITFRPANDTTSAAAFYNAAGSSIGSIDLTSTTVAYNSTSDARLKTDPQPFDGAAIVSALKPYNFQWLSDQTRDYGLFAQEANTVFPEGVTHNETLDRWMVNYSKFVPVLIRALQQAMARISTLEAKVGV